MKILKTKKQLIKAIEDEEMFPPDQSLNDTMKGKMYKCGCGQSHGVAEMPVGAACRGRGIAHSGVGKGFILICDTHATLVVTEGVFNYTFKSIWSISKELFYQR